MSKRSRSFLVSTPSTGWSVTHWNSTPRGMQCSQLKKTAGTFRPLERGIKCCMQRDCMPVQSVDVLRKTPDGMLEIVIDRWVGAVDEHTILQAPQEVLHHWLCMNEGATMGEAFDW